MLRALIVVTLFSTVAYAQAPGASDPAPAPTETPPAPPPAGPTAAPPAAPTAAPTAIAPVPPAPPPAASTVMSRRWSVGLDLGWQSFNVQHGTKPKVTFGMFELAARYRIRPQLEVALALSAGGSAGDLSTGGLYAEFRYRFRVEKAWNLYALGALGVVSVSHKQATDVEKRGRGSLRLGGGLERRFGAFAVDAELRVFGVGENPNVPEPMPITIAYQLARYGLSGGALMIGVTYYF